MKYLVILLFLVASMSSISQPKNSIRLIKIGNTYRETNQYELAEQALKSGLVAVEQQNDVYWQAVAHENLALLYRDKQDSSMALQHFSRAGQLYRQLNLDGSLMAMQQLAESMQPGTTDLYAGIDVGSTGVKLSLLQVKLSAEGRYIYNIIKDTSINSRFADLNSTSMKDTKEALGNFAAIINAKNIPKNKIFVLFSSGAKQAVDSAKMSTAEISNDFLNHFRQFIPNYDSMPFISAAKEAEYSMIGVVFPRSKSRSFLMDIGGSNTKGGYYEESQFNPISFPFGSRNLTIDPGATKLKDKDERELRAISQNPIIQNKRDVFMLGGIVWAMMCYSYPERVTSDYSEFSIDDVSRFKDAATQNYSLLEAAVQTRIDNITNPEIQQKARATLRSVQRVFTPDNLGKGAILLQSVVSAINSGFLRRKYIFINKAGDIAYITGFIVYNISERYKNAKESQN